ncbi:ElyC/SanA/YdcF family protein [Lachnoclostridium phytofermentans]|uniref:ElyC/SanA/YdcF family protein n=1 Tax=Lachnoclostridium phytofermentans TaxID=66219 RepID=UPI0000D7F975|nr:ElyC/SanA/YdcF family protein [Lachnoclostridium phytofermentans]
MSGYRNLSALNGYAPIIVPSGGVSVKTGKFNGVKSKCEIYHKDYLTECDFYTDVLTINNVEKEKIIGENQSGSTAENARFTRQVLMPKALVPKQKLYAVKTFMQGDA